LVCCVYVCLRLSPGYCSSGRWLALTGSRGSCQSDAPGLAPRVAGCSTRRWVGRPGGDLLFRALRRSTIGAEGFHGRVRDGIGCFSPRYGHQAFREAGIGGRIAQPRWCAAAALPNFPKPACFAGSELCACLEGGLPPRAKREGFADVVCAMRLVPCGDDPCRWVRALKRCRAISTGWLRGLPRFHLRPIDVVVYHGSRRDLVLRRVSRLDAFSGYPVRT
jgi:hypothetical protein